MGCTRTFQEVVDKIPCFTCKHFEMSEYWCSPIAWTPRCNLKKKPMHSFRSECPDSEVKTT